MRTPRLPRLALAFAALAGVLRSQAAAQIHDLDYRFELTKDPDDDPADDPSPLLRLELSTNGDASGATAFEIADSWAGFQNTAAAVKDVVARGADGRHLEIDHPRGDQWVVHHEPNERVDLYWSFAESTYDHPLVKSDRNEYRVILEPGVLHLIGEVGLIVPSKRVHGDPCEIGLIWSGFREAGWNVISSFAPDDRPWSGKLAVDKFRHAIFLAGKLRVEERVVHDHPLRIAIFGDDWGFTDAEFADLCASIVTAEREFFSDFDFPHYLVSLLPVGKYIEGGHSIGGTGLTNSFAMFMMPGKKNTLPSPNGRRVARVLAHEMFHHWNGNSFALAEPEQLAYWFSEGFTDFYARRILHRARIADDADFVAQLNEKLEDYQTSKVVSAPATRILADFWTDENVQHLPYQRGDVVAMLIDSRIRAKTSGKQSLDDLMRAIVAEGRKRETPFSVDDLLDRIETATDAATKSLVRGIVVDGNVARIDPSWFAPCLVAREEERGAFELGFDFEQTKKFKTITGVVKDSRAYVAGLRDGQPLRGATVQFGDTHREVEIQVKDGTSDKTIRFLPVGRGPKITLFSLDPKAPDGCCGAF